jgi:V/A-type H+-transporting ATPase subunit A
MSGRLEEMPGEEGYPAYLGSRLSEFYERAGKVKCLGSEGRVGTLTAIGAVSPPGGDLSEPVTQATLRIVKVFWGLDADLAYRRHFPAINWLNSYSLYQDKVSAWANDNVNEQFDNIRAKAMSMLQEEAELNEIVRLVGFDALSEKDQLKLEGAKSIREDFLQQDAFLDIDSYTSLDKQFRLLGLVLSFTEKANEALNEGVYLKKILALEVREQIAKAKFTPEDRLSDIDKIKEEADKRIDELIKTEEVNVGA